MTMTQPNTGRLDPDAPHAYQPRKVTWKGERIRRSTHRRNGWEYPIEDHPTGVVSTIYDDRLPCRHCGGSPELLVHL